MLYETQSIRRRILVPVSIVFFFLLFLFVSSLYWLQQSHIKKDVVKQANVVQQLFSASLSHEALFMASLLQSYGENKELRRAFLAKNRDRLVHVYEKTLPTLRKSVDISHFAFLEQDGRVFLRAHLPEKYGDYPYHFDVTHQQIQPGKFYSGAVVGPTGTLLQRVIYPWYLDNILIGFLGHAKGIGKIAADLKKILNADLVFVSNKSALNKEQLQARKEKTGISANNSQFSDFFLLDSTFQSVPEKLFENLGHLLQNNEDGIFRISAGKEKFACSITQLTNPNNSYIADVVLFHNITEDEKNLNTLTLILTFLSFCLGLLLFLFFYRYTGIIQQRLTVTHSKLQEKIEEHKNTEDALKLMNDTLEEKISERTFSLQEANKKLRASSERFQTVMDSLDALVYVADMKTYEILFINNYGLQKWGDITGKVCWQTLQEGKKAPCEFCTNSLLVDKDGKVRPTYIWEHQNSVTGDWFECHDQAIHWPDGRLVRLQIATNITVRKKAEEEKIALQNQLLQAQKMETMGRFTGGIAHDFNNILTSIIGFSELLLLKIPHENAFRRDIGNICEAGKKAASLVRQLLAFSRKQVMDMEVVNLNNILANMAQILNRVIGDNISLEFRPCPDKANIKADTSQIEQIIMNLAVNARDAMPHGGTLIFETGNILLDEEYATKHAGVTPGNYIFLQATDTGQGIPKEMQEKIFEPFFTTKKHKGTGLGLATVYGIIKQHKGSIFLDSQPGSGSVFKIYFPETKQQPLAEKKRQPLSMPEGNETILVVEDNKLVCNMISQTLRPLGYTILIASSGKEVFAMDSSQTASIDLLLSDVILPEMNGPEVAEKLQVIHPGLKVIFMSGYADDVILRQGIFESNMTFISKPLRPATLARKIRHVLDEGKKRQQSEAG